MAKHRYTKCYRCGKRAKLIECKHCEKYYCEEHSDPKIPLTPNMVFNEKDPVLKHIYEEEWRKGGHVCVPYGEWKLNEAKKQKEIDKETLNKALDSIGKISMEKPYPSAEPVTHGGIRVKPPRRLIKMPRIRIGRKLEFLLLSIALTLIAFYIINEFIFLIEFCSWSYFAYLLYRGLFNKINRTYLGNDANFFMLRIEGLILAVVGVLGLFFTSGLITESFYVGIAGLALVIPFFILSFGLILLSGFIEFRTIRRYPVIGVWRA